MDRRVTDDNVTWESHKSITQINHTNELHKMIMQNKMMSCPGMEMMNDAFGCSRASMEDLRLVNLTEIRPSRRVNASRLLVQALDG